MCMPVGPIVKHTGDGHVLQFSPTEKLIWKATAMTTNGVMDQFELIASPGHEGAPEHIHNDMDEAFYILEGAFRFKAGDSFVMAETGSFLFVPRGTAHTWRNALDVVSRMLLTYIPGGMESFFEEASPFMYASPTDQAALARVNAKFNTLVVGPPISLE